MTKNQIIKFIAAGAAAVYAVWYLNTPYHSHIIDAFDLLMHEAGHWIFWPLGEFMHVLGGSLTQVLIPFIFVGYFWLRRDNYSASLLLLWAGINLADVSVYAADAVTMRLPLLGGDNSIHDWNWLLFTLGQLRHTAAIANAIYASGIAIIIIGITLSFYFAWKTPAGEITK